MALQISYEVPYRSNLVKSGTAIVDAGANHAASMVEFELISGVEDIVVNKLVVTLVATAAATNSSRFVSTSSLTNGITIKYEVDGNAAYTFGTYKNILELDLASDEHYVEQIGTDYIYEFEFKFETPFVLKAGRTDKLCVEVNDDLSSLSGAYFTASGHTTTAKITL
jgi:hypothetical protein